ncbi:hypothetical protein ACMAY6_01815 [Luminiphilus sp. nBUS_16]
MTNSTAGRLQDANTVISNQNTTLPYYRVIMRLRLQDSRVRASR